MLNSCSNLTILVYKITADKMINFDNSHNTLLPERFNLNTQVNCKYNENKYLYFLKPVPLSPTGEVMRSNEIYLKKNVLSSAPVTWPKCNKRHIISTELQPLLSVLFDGILCATYPWQS